MHRSEPKYYQREAVNASKKNHSLTTEMKLLQFKHSSETAWKLRILSVVAFFVCKHFACSEMIEVPRKLTAQSFSSWTQEFINNCKLPYCIQFAEYQHVQQIIQAPTEINDIRLLYRLQGQMHQEKNVSPAAAVKT